MSEAPIRVGFIEDASGWLGGVNYFRNLFRALVASGSEVKPVAVTSGLGILTGLQVGAPVEELRTRLVAPRSPGLLARRVIREVIGRDLLEPILSRAGLAALSHSEVLGRRSRLPSIAWIPDCQHRHLPEFFTPAEVAARDADFRRTCRRATLVIASSEAARNDLVSFYPEAADKVRVLRFVDCSSPDVPSTSREELEAKYGFAGPFFLLPNQFWKHKNHLQVIEAVRILKERGNRVLVLATGKQQDYRSPGWFGELMTRRASAGVEDDFRPLGAVPFADLAGLMRGAVAFINPSRFEGWSTTVEEAKSQGKRILLSDIPVHREQAPARGRYFPLDDAGALADALWEAWTTFDARLEQQARDEAARALPERTAQFGRSYGHIVKEAIARRA